MSDRYSLRCVGILLALLLAACGAEATPVPPATATSQPAPSSAWGTIDLIAQTRQLDAPALTVVDDVPLLAWTGADEIEARHYAQNEAGIAQILALKAYFPFDQMLVPASRGVHLLWLDRTEASNDLRVLSALLDAQGVAVLGPNPLSELRAQRYTALPQPNGGVDVVMSVIENGLSALYRNSLDASGRGGLPFLLRERADHPNLLVDAAGAHWLFWLDDERQVVSRGRLTADGLIDVVNLDVRLPRSTTRQLLAFHIAWDATHAHLFWQVRDAMGSATLYWSSGALGEDSFAEPQALHIFQSDSAAIEVGYNAGTVFAAGLDPTQASVHWGQPLSGQHDFLPVVVNGGNEIGVVYFHRGELVGYQPLVETGLLLRSPVITTDRARNLYVAWSQPHPDGFAELLLTDTRR